MNEILKKAQILVEAAQTNPDFCGDHSDNLFATGERSVDYSAYHFELSDDYYLIIDFVDFSFEDFSIVNRSHHGMIVQEAEEVDQ